MPCFMLVVFTSCTLSAHADVRGMQVWHVTSATLASGVTLKRTFSPVICLPRQEIQYISQSTGWITNIVMIHVSLHLHTTGKNNIHTIPKTLSDSDIIICLLYTSRVTTGSTRNWLPTLPRIWVVKSDWSAEFNQTWPLLDPSSRA